MYKNQLQELAQRSCFNLPSYTSIREGPDHAPRFKACVNFNGEIFESPTYCTTLRQAEHSAAEVALNDLSTRGPSKSLTARILDETGIYKNLLQETAHRAGLNLPVYTTIRSGPGHVPVFTCCVELAGMNFRGGPAKTKKQAEKNAAIAAWSALKKLPTSSGSFANKDENNHNEEQDQVVVTRVLSNLRPNNKDEGKQVWRRDINVNYYSKRKMVREGREINGSSSSICINKQNQQHWRLMDLLRNLGHESSTQKESFYASLLPPPPPLTTSKILPPATFSSSSYDKTIKPQLEEHLKDGEEWLCIGKSDHVTKKKTKETESNSNSRQFPLLDNAGKVGGISMIDKNRALVGSLLNPCPMARNIYSRHHSHSHRIAPAVQIRSVIPVCAAPPSSTMRPPHQVLANPQTLEETKTSSSSSSSGSCSSPTIFSRSAQTGADQVSSEDLRLFNKTELSSPSSQLGSEFDRLQL